jgi:uncharacterized radical SAM superfamily Fe-S cluster-containing enzyme
MRARTASDGYDRHYYRTTTMCPVCERLVPGEVVARGGSVLIARECGEHGYAEGVVCDEVGWYENLPRFDVAPRAPGKRQTTSVSGCPGDCGLCPAHRQSAGTTAIEISNACDAACPVCLADNRGTFELSVEEVREAVEGLLSAQGRIDILTLSGGEPTIHRQIADILSALEAYPIGRIVLNTNGRRIAGDDRFLDTLAQHPNVYVCLHVDGPQAEAVRGIPASMQELALDRLCRWGISAVPLMLGVRGVNDGDFGPVIRRLLTSPGTVKGVILSLVARTGRARTLAARGERLTIPSALRAIQQTSAGTLQVADFIPLPMPNPLCVAVGYFLVLDDRITPIIPLAGLDRTIEFTTNSHFGEPDARFERFFRDTIDAVYAAQDQIPDGARVLRDLRRLVERLYPVGRSLDDAARRRLAEDCIKSVYVMQFMDSWTFDSVRLGKCSCQHLLPAGRIVPSCAYYTYHRRFDPRFARPATAGA